MSGLTAEQIMAYWPNFLRVARNTLPHADQAVHEDIAAASVEKALKSAHRFDASPGNAYGWLAAIARNTAIDYYRSTLRREVQSGHDVWRVTFDAGCERHTDILDLRAALNRLPEFLAPYAHARARDLGIIEAGEAVGLPRATASRREQEMRATLRWLLRADAVGVPA